MGLYYDDTLMKNLCGVCFFGIVELDGSCSFCGYKPNPSSPNAKQEPNNAPSSEARHSPATNEFWDYGGEA